MKRMFGLCLFRLGNWMVEKSHPLLGHIWTKGLLERSMEAGKPMDEKKVDELLAGLQKPLDILVGNWECI